jgi:hypothetical protein
MTCGTYQEQFNSPLDCKFGVENGEVIVAVICIFVVLALLMICWRIACHGSCSGDICMSSPPPSATPKPPSPTFTPSQTATPTIVSAVARVCSVMASDMILGDAGPVQEAISRE